MFLCSMHTVEGENFVPRFAKWDEIWKSAIHVEAQMNHHLRKTDKIADES